MAAEKHLFLHAASTGDLEKFKYLYAFPWIDKNVLNSKGQNAVMLAALHGSVSIVEFLLDKPDTELSQVDNEGNTVLHCAAKSLRGDGRWLVGDTVFDILKNHPDVDREAVNEKGRTGLDVVNLNLLAAYTRDLENRISQRCFSDDMKPI